MLNQYKSQYSYSCLNFVFVEHRHYIGINFSISHSTGGLAIISFGLTKHEYSAKGFVNCISLSRQSIELQRFFPFGVSLFFFFNHTLYCFRKSTY